ncbi:MAG: T9SS type A sorting domain-containing protein [bacterium]|nr:T9SS type A sorting domain-containing protein [bacterium]
MKLLSSLLIVCTFSTFSVSAQLSPGDIAFIGYNTDGVDDFAFIALTDIPAGEVIYFTEEGWNSVTMSWVGTTEGHATYTAPAGGLSCGTVVRIFESATDVLSVDGSGSIALSTGGWSLSAGDQVLAYQAATPEPATVPTFISGVHGDDGNGTPLSLDATTGWNNNAATPLGSARSNLPTGLTNGTDCVSLFPAIGTELDNARYNGTLTGTSGGLRALINDRTNWSTDNSTAYNISPASFTTSVTCSGLPVELSAFEAKSEHNDVDLMWTTETELNNLGFHIMHSLDGENWASIAFVDGMGTTQSRSEYRFTDRSVHSGYHYYQLIQKDWDGASEASPIRSVYITEEMNQDLTLFPNPAIGSSLSVKADKTIESVRIFDATSRGVEIVFERNSQSLDISQLSYGVYTILAETGDGTKYQAVFVKEQ